MPGSGKVLHCVCQGDVCGEGGGGTGRPRMAIDVSRAITQREGCVRTVAEGRTRHDRGSLWWLVGAGAGLGSVGVADGEASAAREMTRGIRLRRAVCRA